MKKLLVIGHTFPEPSTTAAGNRMMQLLALFQEEDYTIIFASSASISERSVPLNSLGIEMVEIKLNHSSFDEFITQLQPTIVLFDRYITEEQFGWRVSEKCSDALKILDTEDLHFLRKAREEAVKNNIPLEKANLFTDIAKRELASILRSDISLIISEVEMELLEEKFQIPSDILFYLPFLIEFSSVDISLLPSFEERSNFITIGNLLHTPNIDSVLFLKKEIWPLVKKQLPKAELHIYGAYAPQHILELHNLKEGFILKGWTSDVKEAMKHSKVCLAPLRFGAGLKGKFVDAMQTGTPSVTTPIGGEGLYGELPFSGSIENEPLKIVEAAIELYANKKIFTEAQQNGFKILENRFQKKIFSDTFKNRILFILKNLQGHRETNFISQILQHQSLQSTKYMSKWIETKNKSNS